MLDKKYRQQIVKKIVKRKDKKKPKKIWYVQFLPYYLVVEDTANITSSTPFFNDTCTGSVLTGGRIADV
jgi:hypothetical protein